MVLGLSVLFKLKPPSRLMGALSSPPCSNHGPGRMWNPRRIEGGEWLVLSAVLKAEHYSTQEEVDDVFLYAFLQVLAGSLSTFGVWFFGVSGYHFRSNPTHWTHVIRMSSNFPWHLSGTYLYVEIFINDIYFHKFWKHIFICTHLDRFPSERQSISPRFVQQKVGAPFIFRKKLKVILTQTDIKRVFHHILPGWWSQFSKVATLVGYLVSRYPFSPNSLLLFGSTMATL